MGKNSLKIIVSHISPSDWPCWMVFVDIFLSFKVEDEKSSDGIMWRNYIRTFKLLSFVLCTCHN